MQTYLIHLIVRKLSTEMSNCESDYFYKNSSLDTLCFLKESGLLLSKCRVQFASYCFLKRMAYDMMHKFAGVHLVFLFRGGFASCLSTFCSLSLCSILPYAVSLQFSRCLCFSHRDVYSSTLLAVRSHLAKRTVGYALSSCQETAIRVIEKQCSFNRLTTSDFKNYLSLASCSSHAFLVA